MSGSCPITGMVNLRTKRAVISLCAALVLWASSAPAEVAPPAEGSDSIQVDGVSFPARIAHAGGNLSLVGAGILPWKFLFRAYAAAFYLPEGVPPAQWSRDIPKRLVIHYFWDIPGDQFGPAGNEVLRRMYTAEELSEISEQLEALDRAYVSVEEGDRYALFYAPGEGTTLFHNDKQLVTLKGAQFARMYFSIWLGSDPVDRDLRDALLGGE